jgi:tetratricopeptide (TPR) repeat protein
MIKGQKREAFGRLYRGALKAIAAFEGRTEAAVEQEFGEMVGVAPATIQRYKQGTIPDLHALEFFAEAAVHRGFLDREWLARFLRVAGHPDAQHILDALRPNPQIDPLPPRARDNLPSPTYTAFVMRSLTFRQILNGLQQRTAVVAIVSLGGMGKSSLALETAKYCLGPTSPHTDIERPVFEAAVWISDKDQPGTTRLSTVLDEIAITLGYPGCTSFDVRKKRSEVDSMLRNRRVLLILDNFETITDDGLIAWLLRLPEPSKALLTTRHYQAEFQRGVWLVEPGGMSPDEAGRLIDQRANQLNLTPITDAAMRNRLIRLTGGNPRALELIISQVKFTHRALADLLDTVAAPESDLLDEIFAQSWALLTPEARLVLRVATLFVASVGSQSLVTITGYTHDTIMQAMQQVCALALAEPVSAARGDTHRLALHPLTRTFITTRADSDGPTPQELAQRWLAWCVQFAGEHGGYQIFAVDQLAILDSEAATLFAATRRAYEQGHDAETIQLAMSLEFYYYVRAYWSKALELHHWAIAAARRRGAIAEEIAALALHIQLLSRQGHHQEADQHMPRLEALIQQAPLHGDRAFHYHHTRGHYLLARARHDRTSLQAAAGHWQWLLDHPEHLDHLMLPGAQHWLAICLAHQGLSDQARAMFDTALHEARTHNVPRFVARNQLGLANLDIEANDLTSATTRLDEVRALTTRDDWEQRARLAYTEGRLYACEHDYPAAERQFDQAISLFARMGLINEQREVEQQRAIVQELGLHAS